ncbi:S-adenosyl-L-methionine-dependent methyltransferase [Camillea tinctor]|nr:S-adenosyl-L-methionine-dependent methyltransferase [Camillea tinctor]
MSNLSDLKSKRRPKKPPCQNPIDAAVLTWLREAPQELRKLLAAQAPRRWTVYEPMVLLPAGSFGTEAWAAALQESGPQGANDLWQSILAGVSQKAGKKGELLTHLAVNEGIPLHAGETEEVRAPEGGSTGNDSNVMRSPSGLRLLYGDFGPRTPAAPDGGNCTAEDFERALWVSTRQNGIYQTWAPRWTMFSRGNIKEKARLLDFHHRRPDRGEDNEEQLSHRNTIPSSKLGSAWAVDLYAGIGYFVFSYAKQGMRVLGWEINPWSVEGLRRGAKGNGWSVKVVQGPELVRPMAEILAGEEQIIVFLEDNAHAERRIRDLRADGGGLDVLHVNCGLLPKSDVVWGDAWDIAGDESERTWLHLHENVGVADIDQRKGEIEKWFTELSTHEKNQKQVRHVRVEHVELVKTYAPGVWHCVFDVYIQRSSSIL